MATDIPNTNPDHDQESTMDTITYTDQQIEDWKSIFGASADYWSWWHSIEHVTGDWNEPGTVRLVIEDPDSDFIGATVDKTFEPKEIFDALAIATEKWSWHYNRHGGELDLDAGSSDLVLQVALFGDGIYG